MKSYETEKIRNVGVVGHGGVGKTSFAEALLYDAGATTRIGSIADGSTTSDYDPQEIKRKHSIHTTVLPIEWNDLKINLIDTPGFPDFIGDVISGLRVADGLLFMFDAVSGMGVTTDVYWKAANKDSIPRVVIINRMDKDRADFPGVLEGIRKKYGNHIVPIEIPIGKDANFKGAFNLITGKAITYEGGKAKEGEVPQDVKDQIPAYKEMLIEALAEVDDTLLTDYMDSKEITFEEMNSALKKGILDGRVVPVLCMSSTKNIGVSSLLEVIRDYLPAPDFRPAEGTNPDTKAPIKRNVSISEPFSAYVFKTVTEPHVGELTFIKVFSGTLASSSSVYNSSKGVAERVGQLIFLRGKNRIEASEVKAGDIVVLPKLRSSSTGDTICEQKQPIVYKGAAYPEPVMALAVIPKSNADQEKIGLAFGAFSHEDPTFKIKYDVETKETVIYGMGDIHLELMIEKLKNRYGVEITVGAPKIPFKETIKGRSKAQGKYKKQTGGHGQFGDTWLEIEPLQRGHGFQFVDKIVGGAIPKNYIPSVEKGVREAMESGVIAGYHVVDVKVTLFDGSYHEVDSSDMAFKIAGSMGFKKAFQEAHPVILEPIMNIAIIVPSEFVGDVSGDLSKRRGKILGMEVLGDLEKVAGQVPLAEIAKYATDLRSMSHGRGNFTTSFSHYQEVPPKVAEDLTTKYQAEMEKGRE
ncbi:MAG: elongation factor G [Candidatus Saganbacteria bacterium]|nr:elongation factor G [Candidatus Saganbacteria bacterium]